MNAVASKREAITPSTQLQPDLCLIAEKGTDWGSWIEGCRAKGLAVSAIIQSPFEAIDDFARRVRRYLETLARDGCAPSTTLLIGASEWNDTSIRARCDAVRALADTVKGRTRLRLVLTCDPHASPSDVAGMHALSDTVANELAGTNLDVACTTPRLAHGKHTAAVEDMLARVLDVARPAVFDVA